MKKYFDVIRLCREDFYARGYDASKISDETMAHIASKMGNAILDGCDFWLSIDYYGEELNMERI